jgi:hypothetical protein
MALTSTLAACTSGGADGAPSRAAGGQGNVGGAGSGAGGGASGGAAASQFARELLYENDLPIEAVGALPSRVHVDDTHVYWVGSAYFRAPKDGSGPRERLADFNAVFMARSIQSDARNVYLKQPTGLDVIPKDGSPRYFVTAPFDWGSTGAYDTSAGLVVFASNQCTRFAALELDGSSARQGSIESSWEVSSSTNVRVIKGVAYCVNANHGLRWTLGSTAPEVIFEMTLGRDGFNELAGTPTELLILQEATGGQAQHLRRIPLPPTLGAEPAIWCSGGDILGGGIGLHLDPTRNALYWTRQGSLRPLELRACSLSGVAGQPHVKLDYESQGQDVRGFTGDDTYFYWTDEYGVWRARKPDL